MPVEKDKALTPEKKQLLIGQVELEIENINKAIRDGGLPSGVLEAVKGNKKKLQDVLNKLFEKRGVITPQETNTALDAIDSSKNARLQTDFKRNIKRIGVFIGLLVILGVGYSIYMKSKSKS